MKSIWFVFLAFPLVLVALLAPASEAQSRDSLGRGGSEPFGGGVDAKMPDGRSRTLLTLKSDAEKSSEDMAKVVELAKELQEEIETNQFHTVDLGSVRKAEEIIRLVRRVKGRLSRSQ